MDGREESISHFVAQIKFLFFPPNLAWKLVHKQSMNCFLKERKDTPCHIMLKKDRSVGAKPPKKFAGIFADSEYCEQFRDFGTLAGRISKQNGSSSCRKKVIYAAKQNASFKFTHYY